MGSDAHIYLSLSASHLLFSKALPRGSGCSFINLKSPVHFLGTQLFTEWFKNRRKMSVLQLPHVFLALGFMGITSCAEEGRKLSHHPLCPHWGPQVSAQRQGNIHKATWHLLMPSHPWFSNWHAECLGSKTVSILYSFSV